MDLNNYLLAGLTPPGIRGGVYEEWIQLYNNSGGDLANGAIKVVSFLVDITAAVSPVSSATNPAIFAVPLTPSAQATTNLVCVIDNPLEDVAGSPVTEYKGIKSTSTGWAKTKGIVQALCNGGSAIAIGDLLKVTSPFTAFTLDSAATAGVSPVLAATSCAVSLVAYSTGTNALEYIYLIGRRCTIS